MQRVNFSILAPTVVRNFVVVQTNKSEATLTWEIPEYPNGIIVHYSVAYNGHNTKVRKLY